VLNIIVAGTLVVIGIDPSIAKLNLDRVISYFVGDNVRGSAEILVRLYQSINPFARNEDKIAMRWPIVWLMIRCMSRISVPLS